MKGWRRMVNISRFRGPKLRGLNSGDPRLSLEERYGDHQGYVSAVVREVRKLEQQRFLLPVDVKKYIDEAKMSDILS
ncbi:MAG: hypothetical protein CM1200mP35_07040 [Chloroflexota bacterium]|nr:MAG: hypothetical protein CM1200mP35_07040 [Chloroflexota bacterium]